MIDPVKLQLWLDPLNDAPLECDGMSRVISALLSINGIEHQAWQGLLLDCKLLEDHSVGPEVEIAVTHWWIKLADGSTIDYRARMWLGDDAPHGVFQADPAGRFRYVNAEPTGLGCVPLPILSLIAGIDLLHYPGFEDAV